MSKHQPVIVVVRNPDDADDIATFGFEVEPTVIYLDLGASFDITHGIGADEVEDAQEWLDCHLAELAELPEDHPARPYVEQTLAQVEEAIGRAS